ncbi:MAG: 2,3-bisphosphoglycerate-independent phosphoglycerate mutase [Candidatus Tectomicrobia bacterium]|nr:2,3-bisphosphoglycerate-independent phosphoglycerate mutase [Candidatus Tectomicrobia bacterium]
MNTQHLVRRLVKATPSKIVFLILDGLGGFRGAGRQQSELEAARLPHLDALAAASSCGLSDPIAPGITPGSGPSHLALFGYDPVEHDIGRGLLSALGVDFPLQPSDLAARMNYCTVRDGLVTDRRAGRVPTAECARLCRMLAKVEIAGVEVFVQPEQEHRAALILRGEGLDDHLTDSDPQVTCKAPLRVQALEAQAERAATIVNEFVRQAGMILKDERPANMVLLRGFARYHPIPSMQELYRLNPACIAVYPMYKGVTRLIGMKVLETGPSLGEEVATLETHWQEHDFFYLHVKKTDSAGEDGNFDAKVAVLEEVDGLLGRILGLRPEVLVITGDHSTPSALKGHSWHPVPVLMHGRWCWPDEVRSFTELAFSRGCLGRLRATDIMPLALASAEKLAKYGA